MVSKQNLKIIKLIKMYLTKDLLKEPYKSISCIEVKDPMFGHCYVASEACYYLFAKDLGYCPYYIKHENSTHWFLKDTKHNIIDITASQFETKVPYKLGKRIGFLTNKPSKRAKKVIDNVLGK